MRPTSPRPVADIEGADHLMVGCVDSRELPRLARGDVGDGPGLCKRQADQQREREYHAQGKCRT